MRTWRYLATIRHDSPAEHEATFLESLAIAKLPNRDLCALYIQTHGPTKSFMCISERTVKSHVSNILGKLHLADRTQAAVFAWREGTIRR